MIWLLLCASAGAVFYRMRGGWPNWPRPIEQCLFCLVFLYQLYSYNLGWPWIAAGYILAVIGTCTGHGGFMDLGTWLKARARERLEFLIICVENKLSPYWYDALGLAVTGLAVTAGPAIMLAINGHCQEAALTLLSGFTKPVAYMISRKSGFGTEGGEWLTGAFQWAAIVLLSGPAR
jgi:hypothetical protein